jgi:hypothetical protein
MPTPDIPSDEEIIGKLRKHGFLLEEAVAEYFDREEVRERWFSFVTVERAFHFPDPDEGKSREIDVRVAGDMRGHLDHFYLAEGPANQLVLLIECKFSHNAHVLLTRDWESAYGEVQSPIASPVREADSGLTWEGADWYESLGSSRVAHQMVRVTKQNASSVLYDYTAGLVKCAAHTRRDTIIAETWDSYFSAWQHHINAPLYRHIIPVVVIDAPLLELEQGQMQLAECLWMPLCCSYHSAALRTQGYVVIDVVQKQHFEQYFESVLIPRVYRGCEVIEGQFKAVKIPPMPDIDFGHGQLNDPGRDATKHV